MSPRCFAGLALLALAVSGADTALAQAQDPASSTATGAALSPQATPAASSPASPSPSTAAPGAHPAPALAVADPPPAELKSRARAAASPAVSDTAAPGPGGSDRIELGTTEISGNRELPKLMYIVPWQRPGVGKITGRPPNSLVDEALTPVDRTVFGRQNSYYAALQAASASDASQPAAPEAPPAAAVPRDEK